MRRAGLGPDGLVWRIAQEARERFPDSYAPLFAALGGDLGGIDTLRATRRKKVFRQSAPDDPSSFAYLKVYDGRGVGTFLSPPAWREARGMRLLGRLGVASPRVEAVGVAPLHRQRERSVLLSVTPARFRPFGEHAHRVLDLSQGSRADLIEDLGRLHELLRRMHDAGFVHGDLNLGNVLFDPGAREFCLIDFHRSRAVSRVQPWLRCADLGKLREFFGAHLSDAEGDVLLRDGYGRGDGRLFAALRWRWETARQYQRERKVAGILKNAQRGEQDFARRRLAGARVTYARQAGIAPEALLDPAAGGDARVLRLGTFATAAEARRAWCEEVRRAASGLPGPMPLACIEQDGGSVVLGLDGQEPRYSLRRVFSLRRFAVPGAVPPIS